MIDSQREPDRTSWGDALRALESHFDQLIIINVPNTGDERGESYSLASGAIPDWFVTRDAHISTLSPGHLRGNHFHSSRDEILVVRARTDWTFAWDTGPMSSIHRRQVSPSTTVIHIPRNWSHAVINTGTESINILGLANTEFDQDIKETHHRSVWVRDD